VLATVLCINRRTDGISPAWSQYESYIQREVDWFGGRLFKARNGSPAATFDGPARAIRCACAILELASRLRLDVGVGLHTGECNRSNTAQLEGSGVEITSEIAERAPTGEALISGTVRDLVAGSPYSFEYRATLTLRTQVGEYRLYQVRTAFASAATEQ
jgi:class 3 adenylate cyclase